MTNHFTTPEFADVLKQHGIEIDTPFYIVEGEIFLKRSDFRYICIYSGFEFPAKDPKPAYLLSQVLGWLPECVKAYDGGIGRRNVYYNGKELLCCYTTISAWKSIEQLITKGLAEGWLTKEIIEQQIKQNQ